MIKEKTIKQNNETTILSKFRNNINIQEFIKNNLGVWLENKDTLYLLKVKRRMQGKDKFFLGCIQRTDDCFSMEAIIDFELRHTLLMPTYGGDDLEMVLERIEKCKYKRNLCFKLVDIIKYTKEE